MAEFQPVDLKEYLRRELFVTVFGQLWVVFRHMCDLSDLHLPRARRRLCVSSAPKCHKKGG